MQPDQQQPQLVSPKVENPSMPTVGIDVPSNKNPKPGSKKILIIIVTILGVIATTIGVILIILQITKPTSPLDNDNGPDQLSQSESNPESTPDATSTDEKNVVPEPVADIPQDLLGIVNFLLGSKLNGRTMNGRTIETGRTIYYDDIDLMRDGKLSETWYINNIIAFKATPINLTTGQVQTIIDNENYPDEYKKRLTQGYDGTEVATLYKQLFGTEIQHQTARANCLTYAYDAATNIYYDYDNISGVGGCGGSTTLSRYYYPYDYAVSDSNAFVYVAAAMLEDNGRSITVYCDVTYSIEELNSGTASVCSHDATKQFTLNSSNYQDFAKYRFVFNRADDWTYYFNKVEKYK